MAFQYIDVCRLRFATCFLISVVLIEVDQGLISYVKIFTQVYLKRGLAVLMTICCLIVVK